MLTFGRLVGTFMARPYVALDATEAIASAAARGGRVVVALQGLGSVGGKGQGKGQGEGEGQGEDKGRGVLLQLEVATAPPFSAASPFSTAPAFSAASAASAAAAAAYGGSGGGRADGKTTASQAASGVERPHIRKAAPTGFLGVISGYGVVDDGSVEESASASVKSKLAASASKLISVMHGVGELDIKDGSAAPKGPPLPPFLVLDLRDDVAFAKSHIRGALHFPISRLSRAQNYYLPEMHAYINTLGKAIVLYDDDERVATKAATTFVERGVDNGFVLSGGLNVMNDRFPSQQMMWQVGESEEDSFLALTAENLALLRNHIQEMGPPTMSSRGSSRATSRSVSRSTTQSTARGGSRARKGRP